MMHATAGARIIVLLAALGAPAQQPDPAKAKANAAQGGAKPQPASADKKTKKPAPKLPAGASQQQDVAFQKQIEDSVVTNASDPDDHIRCFFTLNQLKSLQPVPAVARLTEADESRVITGIVKTVSEANEKDLAQDRQRDFMQMVKTDLEGKLVGKTPGEALTTVMTNFYEITKATKLEILEKAAQAARDSGSPELADAIHEKLLGDDQWFVNDDPAETSFRVARAVAQVGDDFKKKGGKQIEADTTAADKVAAASGTLTKSTKKANGQFVMSAIPPSPDVLRDSAVNQIGVEGGSAELKEKTRLRLTPSLGQMDWYVANNANATANMLAKNIKAAATEVAQSAQEKQKAAVKSTKEAADAGSEAAKNGGNADVAALLDTARSEINRVVAPDDVFCAYQVLSWKDTRLMFGRSVANEFIAVQVTVRNLNAQEEFLVHNAMLRVDTDLHGATGRYYEGMDKIAVEAYNNAGESLTARGIVGNSITAASALLSALQPIVNVDNFTSAASAFSSGAVGGWKTLSPDHQREQLLAIANYGFSATDNFKTVIPKSTAGTFYTWFPVKQFTQGWWLQKCARDTAGMKPAAGVESPQYEDADGEQRNPPEVGANVCRAQALCKDSPSSEWEDIPFKKWSSISDELFRELSMVVVAGIHVREDSKNAASVTDLKCPTDTQGRFDLTKASNGTLSCDVTGQNLDKVTKLRLENAGNVVDPERPEAVLSEPNTDNTAAKASFNVKGLQQAQGEDYTVFTVGKDGTEKATSLKVHLNKTTPAIDQVEPKQVTVGTKPLKLTLTGKYLDQLKSICIKPTKSGTNKTVNKPADQTSATQIVVDLSSAELTQDKWSIYADQCPDSGGSSSVVLEVKAAAAEKTGKK